MVFFDGLWLQFAVGLLVYYVRVYPKSLARRYGIAVLLTSFGLIFLLRVFSPPAIVNGLSRSQFFDGTCFAIFFGFTLIAIEKYDVQISTFWLVKPLMACGAMCYSLYLTHLPVISCMRKFAYRELPEASRMYWVDAVLTFFATLVVGAIFFLLIERRFMNKPFTIAKTMLPAIPINTESHLSERLGL